MTIKQIKSRLSILTVLAYYGLAPDRNQMMCCPFHDDQAASMRVYAETNTVYCFAGGCKVSNLDAIDFIMYKDGGTKHEAIKKAQVLLGGQSEVPKITTAVEVKEYVIERDLVRPTHRYRKVLATHEGAQAYCVRRGLMWERLALGYKSRQTHDKWGRGCIIFVLRNQKNKMCSLYGRSIYGPGHYYQAGRTGLYPNYPSADTRTLILTESIIDAASLRFWDFPGLDLYAILALFGTNGLTAEHRSAIGALRDLREVILALDNDMAGRAAESMIAGQLLDLHPSLHITRLPLPKGEDVNSVAAACEDIETHFTKLFSSREKVEVDRPEVVKKKLALPETGQKPDVLDTSHPYNLIFTTHLASYQIKGGLRKSERDLDSLKVTLVVSHDGRKSRQKLDLYEDKQVLRVARSVSERLGLRPDLLEVDLSRLTDQLEAYREGLLHEQPGPSDKKAMVTGAMRSKCEAFLEEVNLLERINELIGQAGVAGEQTNRLLLFIVASSYQMPTTLHALIQGASGSGKTRLLRVISDLMPEEKVKRYTRVTDGSFYNQGEYFFTNKLLCFEDIDGLKEDALLAVRELQSNEILITSTSFKDEHGGIRGGERIVRGPIASISCTTRAEVYEDNISRCFVVAVDESQEQSLRIIQYQNDRSAGLIDGKGEKQAKELLQNCMRLLRPMEVINPYANKIRLPRDAHKIRRLNELYQSFVRQITLLHQYQRERDDRGRLISTVSDLQAACDILFESIVLKVDELDGSLRQFFEQLKGYVKSKGRDYEFNRFEVRQATGVSKTQQHRYMSSLLDLEYLQQYGFANRGYRYKIAQWDDIAALRLQLKNHLSEQLAEL